MTQVKLVDTNKQVVDAWKKVFKDHPEVQCIHGNLLTQEADVWVTPTNSKGNMSGGVDYAIKNQLGQGIEDAIQEAIANIFGGTLPVGKAVIVPAGNHSHEFPRFVVATPSMVGDSDNLKRTKNTALACAAAFQAIYYAEDKKGAAIDTVVIPGLGAGTGQTPPDVCAELMFIGYTLFQRKRYDDFDEMLEHLNEELYGIGLGEAAKAGPQPGTGQVAQTIAGGIEKGAVHGWEPPVTEDGEFIKVQVPSIEMAKSIKDAKKAGQTEIKESPAKNPIEGTPIQGSEQEPVQVVTNKSEASHVEQSDEGDYVKNMPIGTPLI